MMMLTSKSASTPGPALGSIGTATLDTSIPSEPIGARPNVSWPAIELISAERTSASVARPAMLFTRTMPATAPISTAPANDSISMLTDETGATAPPGSRGYCRNPGRGPGRTRRSGDRAWRIPG
jgi:hypothetical protein